MHCRTMRFSEAFDGLSKLIRRFFIHPMDKPKKEETKKTTVVRDFKSNLHDDEENLFKFVASRDHVKTKEILEAKLEGQDVLWEKTNDSNETLIERAILNDDVEMLEILLNAARQSLSKSQEETFSSLWRSALDLATLRQNHNMVDIILDCLIKLRKAHQSTPSIDSPDNPDNPNTIISIDQNAGEQSHKEKSNSSNNQNNKKSNDIVLISAAKYHNFKAVQKLVNEEYVIEIGKHNFIEVGKDKRNGKENEDLVAKIQHDVDKCKAFASPEYIIMTEEDPILAYLKCIENFRSSAFIHPEHEEEFEDVLKGSSNFAIDLLNMCKSEKEVECILRSETGENRLRDFIELKEKKFITHPLCQQVIYSWWLGDELKCTWPEYGLVRLIRHVVVQILLAPILCSIYVIDPNPNPKTWLSEALKRLGLKPHFSAPMNRFIYSATSYLFFLFLLLYSSIFKGANKAYAQEIYWNDWLVFLWVMSLAVKVGCDIFTETISSSTTGNSKRIRFHFWTGYDVIMMILFISSSISFLIARCVNLNESTKINALKPSLAAEGISSIAITMAIIRVLAWFHLSRTLSHIIISFSRMTEVVFKLLVVYGIVILAFSFGLYTIYKDYHHEANNGKGETLFMTYTSTLKALFWAIFGEGDADYAVIPEDNKSNTFEHEDRKFSIIIGYILWGIYHISFVLILLNMLIAIMSNSYQAIQNNSDMEWKFARTRLWLHYFDDHNLVPPPFNLFRTIKDILILIYKFCSKPKRCCNNTEQKKIHDELIHRYMIKQKMVTTRQDKPEQMVNVKKKKSSANSTYA